MEKQNTQTRARALKKERDWKRRTDSQTDKTEIQRTTSGSG